MSLFETCIHRPVFAIVMTLLLVLFGLLSFLRLPVREYPDIKPPIVSVRTIYQGASASVVELDVTTPLEGRAQRYPRTPDDHLCQPRRSVVDHHRI